MAENSKIESPSHKANIRVGQVKLSSEIDFWKPNWFQQLMYRIGWMKDPRFNGARYNGLYMDDVALWPLYEGKNNSSSKTKEKDMGEVKGIKGIDATTKEGRLLMATLCILTTQPSLLLLGERVNGSKMQPEEMLEKVDKLQREMFADSQEEVNDFRKMAEGMWSLLDDIDTLGDAIKPSDFAGFVRYWEAVHKVLRKRFAYFKSDGHDLFTKEEWDKKQSAMVESLFKQPIFGKLNSED